MATKAGNQWDISRWVPSTKTPSSAARNTSPLQISNFCPVQLSSHWTLWGSQTHGSHTVRGLGCMKFGETHSSTWCVVSHQECGPHAALNRILMSVYHCCLWDVLILTCSMQSAMNINWLITLSTKELNSSLFVLFRQILHMECPTFKHVILFLSALMSSGQLLFCHAHSHVINWLPATNCIWQQWHVQVSFEQHLHFYTVDRHYLIKEL